MPPKPRRAPFPKRPDLAPAVALPMANKQAAAALVEVGLGEREGIVYPNARAPQHHDQTTHPPSASGVSRLTHDRDERVSG